MAQAKHFSGSGIQILVAYHGLVIAVANWNFDASLVSLELKMQKDGLVSGIIRT